jgi:hypothetical protein
MYIQGDWVRRAFLMDWTVLICYICSTKLMSWWSVFFRVCYATLCIQLCRGHWFFAMDVLYQLNLIMSWLLYVFLLWILNATLIQLWIKRLLSLLCMLNTALIQLCRGLRFYFLLCMFNTTLIQLCRGLRFYFFAMYV